MGQWISRTFGSITLNVWQTDTTGNQTVYNVASWPMNTKVTAANKEQFRSTVNAYLSYIADKDLTHQLYTNYNSGVSTTLSNGNGIEFQSNGLNVVYVTYEFDHNFNDVQYSLSGYLPYRRTDLNVGMQFRCIFSGANPDSMSEGHMLLKEGNTTVSDFEIISSSIAIDDITFHDTSARVNAWDIHIPGYSGETIGSSDVMSYINPPMIMCEYVNGNTDKLMISMEEPASSSNYLMPIDGFYCYPSLGIDVAGEQPQPQEDGYVNELDNRFSPRTHSIMTGMYVAFADTIAGVEDYQMSEIASALMTFDLGDAIKKTLLGSDGKEFIISVNWFYGIRAGLAAKNMILGPSDFRVGGQWPKAGLTPGHVVPLNNVGTEYFLWETPELSVGHKFGDYRDYLANYKIFLPYYGFVDIDPNDAVDAYIKIYYNINMLSRAADIVITTRSSRTNNQNVKIMSLSTTVGVEVPFGADACKSMMLAVAQTAGKAITTAASVYLGARTGQIGAAIASNSAANAYDTSMMNASIMSGNNVVDLNAASKGVTDKLSENASLRKQAAGIKAVQNAIPDMPNMAIPSTTRSNGSGSENGSLDELHPYMLIEWPVTCEPNDWEDYVGIPASASTYLTANLGFTQVGAVHPDSMANAPKYIDEIIAQLKAGVYL